MSDSDWGSDSDELAVEVEAPVSTTAPPAPVAEQPTTPVATADTAYLSIPRQVFLGVLVKCYLIETDPKCQQPIYSGLVVLFDPPEKKWTLYAYHVQNQQQPIFLETLNDKSGFATAQLDSPFKLFCDLKFGKGGDATFMGNGRKWRLDFSELNIAFRALTWYSLIIFIWPIHLHLRSIPCCVFFHVYIACLTRVYCPV